MVPNFLSRILESLPGRPRTHVKVLVSIIIGIQMLLGLGEYLSNQPSLQAYSLLLVPVIILGIAIIFISSRGMWNMATREIVDLRDWLVLSSITATLSLSVALWFIAGGIADGFQWFDLLLYLGAPMVCWDNCRTFINVLAYSEKLPNWQTTILIKRREAEGEM